MVRPSDPKSKGKVPPPEPRHAFGAAAPATEAQRRNVVVAILAAVFGGIAGIFPVLAGLPVILSPLFKKKDSAGGGKAPLSRVGTVDSVPSDGTPINVPVLADKVDAWTREANQPIGAVFLRRNGGEIECFNAICPHAGCMVAYAGERSCFQCPCHTSQFQLDGARVHPSPSPRDMDRLTIDPDKLKSGEIWVEFINYYPGKADQEPKA